MEGVDLFTPNDITHKAFGDALRLAKENGVEIIVKECIVTPDTLSIDGDVPVNLNHHINRQ